jgi:hypothetical protein
MTYPERWPDGTIKSTGNAFTDWKEPGRSIFLTSGFDFRATKSGKTQSQTASEVVEGFRAENGHCRGTVHGISKRADKVLENRWGSPYLKPGSEK